MIGLIYDYNLHKSKFSMSKLLITAQCLTKQKPQCLAMGFYWSIYYIWFPTLMRRMGREVQ